MVWTQARASVLKPRFDDLVLAHVVNDQFVLLFNLDEQFTPLRILERLSSFLHENRRCLLNLLLGWLVCPELFPCPLFLPIRIDRLLLRSLSEWPPLAFAMA
ncbi:MAG: hypothetical protein A4E19_12695 [Nitrospira sp. SG-bin1]|nr:MAG: hypothetical protein A4E19_12695 [Nitrospira sp. SG-bin1]